MTTAILARTPTISYPAHPGELTVGEIIAEILWLGDALTWPGAIGDWARQRAVALRSELREREAL